ncbi:MAG: hypothetical protein P1V20_28665 [Verrucomicrobiales bacterium]|nr:hypothetical protein [Verrucomicrobiales bacterium]
MKRLLSSNLPACSAPPSSPRLRYGSLICAIAFAVVQSGCTKTMLGTQAMSFNKTVHDHRVEQLLINILRAAHREPVSMTSIGSIQTINKKEANIGPFNWEFGSRGIGPNRGAFSGSVSQQPTMKVTILDDQPKFAQGFMQVIDEKTISFFLDQGWNPEILAYLIVEKIDNTDHGTVYNDPKDAERFLAFQNVIRENVDFIRTHGGKLEIEGSDAVLRVRSPQGILYYLGEIARAQLYPTDTGIIPSIYDESIGVESPLFLVYRKIESPYTGVSVSYRGANYHMPVCLDNRSGQSLNLLQQIINLQEKDVDTGISTIQLVGG